MPRPNRLVIGVKYGRLTPLAFPTGEHVLCTCSCGAIKDIRFKHMMSGKTQSCGCLHKELQAVAAKVRNTTHGKFGTPIYAVWNGMISRCHNPNSQAYVDYGARGIKVCEAWRKFENFYADMGDAPPGLTLDREKNNLGYSPENCRWVSMQAQQNNKRNNVVLQFRGKSQNATQWSEELGIPRQLIYVRVRAGWSAERTLTEPKRHKS